MCREGLKHHPNFTTGRIVLAKVHLCRGNFEEAGEELKIALEISPSNEQARQLLNNVENKEHVERVVTDMESAYEEEEPETASEWQTITMAKIYVAQGHKQRAQQIFHSILEREPENEDAKKGLASINS